MSIFDTVDKKDMKNKIIELIKTDGGICLHDFGDLQAHCQDEQLDEELMEECLFDLIKNDRIHFCVKP